MGPGAGSACTKMGKPSNTNSLSSSRDVKLFPYVRQYLPFLDVCMLPISVSCGVFAVGRIGPLPLTHLAGFGRL
jgi:hypothetical protein